MTAINFRGRALHEMSLRELRQAYAEIQAFAAEQDVSPDVFEQAWGEDLTTIAREIAVRERPN